MPVVDWVLLGSGESNKGYICGSPYLQLVCRSLTSTHLLWLLLNDDTDNTFDNACTPKLVYGFQVLLDGTAVGRLSRNGPVNLTLDAGSALRWRSGEEAAGSYAVASAAASVTLEVIVEAVGRSNQGWRFDTKGLLSPDVQWNGATICLDIFLCLASIHLHAYMRTMLFHETVGHGLPSIQKCSNHEC